MMVESRTNLPVYFGYSLSLSWQGSVRDERRGGRSPPRPFPRRQDASLCAAAKTGLALRAEAPHKSFSFLPGPNVRNWSYRWDRNRELASYASPMKHMPTRRRS